MNLADGGGLVIRSTSRVAHGYVGSSGVGALGAIYGNSAKWGGGVTVVAGSGADESADILIGNADPDPPVAIRGNFASEGGGAIYAWPEENFSGGGLAWVSVTHADISDNAALRGAVAYADVSGDFPGSDIAFGSNLFGPEFACGAYCVHIFGNESVDANGAATDGALFHVTDQSRIEIERGLVDGNAAGRVFDSDGRLEVHDSLVAGNTLQYEVVRSSGILWLGDSTLAGNAVGAPNLIEADRSNNTVIARSILWQPGHVSALDVVEETEGDTAVDETLVLPIPARVYKTGHDLRLVFTDEAGVTVTAKRDLKLIRFIARGRRWYEELRGGRVPSIMAIARREKLNDSYVARVVCGALLAPDIVEHILHGTQPVSFTVETLKTLPPWDWKEQRRRFGFAPTQ